MKIIETANGQQQVVGVSECELRETSDGLIWAPCLSARDYAEICEIAPHDTQAPARAAMSTEEYVASLDDREIQAQATYAAYLSEKIADGEALQAFLSTQGGGMHVRS